MTRNLKALGLALVAVFAMSAITASGASAQHLFHSEAEHTILDSAALNAQVFTATGSGNKVSCTGLGGTATLTQKTVTSITFTPNYTGCTAIVGGSSLEARVTFTECDYVITSHTNATGHFIVHVECPTTPTVQEIHIEVFILGKFRPCYTIPMQTPTSGGVSLTNEGVGTTRDIRLKATVEGIEYTKEGSCGSGTLNDADYTGEATIKGTDTNGNHVGIWRE